MSDANDTVPGAPRLRLPQGLVPTVFALVILGLVSCIVRGVTALVHTGLDAGYPLRWLSRLAAGMDYTFPLVAFFGPRVRRFVEASVRERTCNAVR
jgi:hypothetical protein